MRWLVCGSRDYRNRLLLFSRLRDLMVERGAPSVVIEGEAAGADTLAREWAEAHGIEVRPFPADWTLHGRAAGPIRNRQMLTEGEPTLVVAFYSHPSPSRGKANMVQQARTAGVEVIEVIP